MINLQHYRQRIESGIAELKHRIEVMQRGSFSVRSRDGNGWVDITPECLAADRRVLETYELILAEIDSRQSKTEKQ